MKKVAVFCGAATGTNLEIVVQIQALAQLLAAQHCELIYGGGNRGLMGIIANAMLEQGGKVIGIMPHELVKKELAHTDLSELILTENFATRKNAIFNLADTIILLPGGLGSLDEFFDALNQIHIGNLQIKIGILNTQDFYTPLLQQLQHIQQTGFMLTALFNQIHVATNPAELLQKLQTTQPVDISRWQPVASKVD